MAVRFTGAWPHKNVFRKIIQSSVIRRKICRNLQLDLACFFAKTGHFL